MSKHDIMLITFKFCVSKMYLIVMVHNLKTHRRSDQPDW